MGRNAKEYLSNVFEGARIQFNVIRALYYREILTRVGKSKFGIIGIYFDPLSNILVLLLIFGVRRGFGPILGLDLVLFIGIGRIIYALFRFICIRSINSLQANKALFTHKRVKPIDTIITRSIVEMLSLGVVFSLIVLGYSIIKETWFIVDLPLILFSFLCITILSFGLGLIVMIAGFRYPIIQIIVPIIIRPFYFLSGVFFSIQSVPQWLKPWLSWNPILQAIELTRKGFSEKYFLDPVISGTYLFIFVIFTLCLSLYIYQRNERLLIAT